MRHFFVRPVIGPALPRYEPTRPRHRARTASGPEQSLDRDRPLISATHLADRLGVSRNTVRIRMAAWRKEGFLVHQVAIPNPDLFGARLTGLMLRAEEPAAKARLQEAVQMADDVFCSTEMGPFVWTVYLERYATAMDRWKRYLSKLEGVRIEGAPTPIPLPPCSRALTRLDWRLIEAVQTLDRPHTGELARRVGVNRRTVTRHFQALIMANALFVYPIWDFAQTSGAIPFLSVRMAPDANTEMVRETISKLFPAQVPVSPAIPAFIGSDGALGNGSSKQYRLPALPRRGGEGRRGGLDHPSGPRGEQGRRRFPEPHPGPPALLRLDDVEHQRDPALLSGLAGVPREHPRPVRERPLSDRTVRSEGARSPAIVQDPRSGPLAGVAGSPQRERGTAGRSRGRGADLPASWSGPAARGAGDPPGRRMAGIGGRSFPEPTSTYRRRTAPHGEMGRPIGASAIAPPGRSRKGRSPGRCPDRAT